MSSEPQVAAPVTPAPFDLGTAPSVRDVTRLEIVDGETKAPLGFWVEVAGRHSPRGRAASIEAARIAKERFSPDPDAAPASSEATDPIIVEEWKREVACRVVTAWSLLEHGAPLACTEENVRRLYAKRPDAWPQVYDTNGRLADFFDAAATS